MTRIAPTQRNVSGGAPVRGRFLRLRASTAWLLAVLVVGSFLAQIASAQDAGVRLPDVFKNTTSGPKSSFPKS